MAGQSDIDSINAYLAHLQANGGRLGVNAKGTPVIPASAVAQGAKPAPAAPAAPAGAPAAPAAKAGKAGRAKPLSAAQSVDQTLAVNDVSSAEVRNVGSPKGPASTKNDIFSLFGRGVDWIASRPTPGGNLALVLILVFFAWAIIPVNHGATRLQLLWLVLTGKADLVDQPDTSQGSDNGGSWWQPYLDPGNTNGASASGGASGGGPGRIAAPSLPIAHPSAVEWRPDDILASPRGPGL